MIHDKNTFGVVFTFWKSRQNHWRKRGIMYIVDEKLWHFDTSEYVKYKQVTGYTQHDVRSRNRALWTNGYHLPRVCQIVEKHYVRKSTNSVTKIKQPAGFQVALKLIF